MKYNERDEADVLRSEVLDGFSEEIINLIGALNLAKEVEKVVDDKAQYTDWNQRDDIKAELKVA